MSVSPSLARGERQESRRPLTGFGLAGREMGEADLLLPLLVRLKGLGAGAGMETRQGGV